MNGQFSGGSLNKAQAGGYVHGMWTNCRIIYCLLVTLLATATGRADRDVQLTGVPDYNWFYGCFGTGSGNLMGYWDRHGLPNLYTGPINGGLAPLDTLGANAQIWTMWASRAGYGGRPTNEWGHVDDYVGLDGSSNGGGTSYKGTNDPYKVAGRAAHSNDCIGDFMGLSQYDWTNLNNECAGNINAYAFNYFETSGVRRYNFAAPTPDIQSGLRAYVRYCGYEADLFTQVANVYPKTPAGRGFNFHDFMQCIDAGYPVLMQLQVNAYVGAGGNNPDFHAVMGYGYQDYGVGNHNIYYRNSWAQGEKLEPWDTFSMDGLPAGFYIRGVYVLMPKPEITGVSGSPGQLTVTWQGGDSVLVEDLSGGMETTHWYVVESGTLDQSEAFQPVSLATTARSRLISNVAVDLSALRVRNLIRVRFQDEVLGHSVTGQIVHKYGPTNLLFDIDLEQVEQVVLPSNQHWNLRGLEYAINATNFDLRGNVITNLEILARAAERGGLRAGTVVDVRDNPLDVYARSNQIPVMTSAGATVLH